MKTTLPLSLAAVLILVLGIIGSVPLLAQHQVPQQPTTTSVPNLIRYSGVLKDATGALLPSQTLGVTFSIYKEAEGGVSLWHETRNVASDPSGQYNVLLGSTMSEGVPVELFADQEQRWLSVQIQGQPEQARVLLVSVPYAFKAHEAETLGGLPPSAFVKAEQGTAAGAASDGMKTTTVADGKSSAGASSLQSGQDGTPWVRDGNTIKLLTDTDKVGIGTSTPKAKLEVEGDIHASGSISSGNATVTINGNQNTITVDSTTPQGTPPCPKSAICIGGEDPNNSNIKFENVQVGIGTKAPGGSKLAVFDPQFPTISVTNFPISSTIPAGSEWTVAYQAGFFSNFAKPGDTVIRTGGGASGNLILTARDSNNGGILFGTGQACAGGNPCETLKMSLLQSGNFGIGSSNPPTTFAVGDFLNATDQSNPPFQLDKFGDMVRIKKVGYSWPLALGTAGAPYVLTDKTGNGALTWEPANSAGGNVIGPNNPPCLGNLLTKWTGGGPNVNCSHVYEENVTGFYHVGIAGIPNNAQLDVLGNLGNVNTTNTQSSYMIGYDPVLSIYPSNTSGNLFVGVAAGKNSGGTSDNTFAGYKAGTANTANGNTFYGSQAGMSNTSGLRNTFIGFQAGMSNTNNAFGVDNTFVGYNAGKNSKTSQGNTFVGTNAGLATGGTNANDCCNTYIGKFSGMKAQTSNNTFLGYRSGEVTTAGNNTFVGTKAATANISGTNNVFIGAQVAYDNGVGGNVTGSQNVYIGVLAGSNTLNTNGSDNIFIGMAAGANESTVSNNIEIGNPGPAPHASNSILIGNSLHTKETYVAGIYKSPITTDQMVVVDASGHLGSQTISGGGGGTVLGTCLTGTQAQNFITKWLDFTTVQCSSIYENTTAPPIGPQVGIGTGATFVSSPHAKLEIAYSDLVTTANPHPSVLRLVNRFQSPSDLTETGIMFNSGVAGLNEDIARIYSKQDSNWVADGRFSIQVHSALGPFADVVNVKGNTNGAAGPSVGINTVVQNLATLDVNGGLGANDPKGNLRVFELDPFVSGKSEPVCRNTSTLILSKCSGSSERFKENVTDMADSGKLFQLRPVTYFYKRQYDDGSRQLQHGLIAEEVAKLYPDLVEYEKNGQPYTVKYQMLAPLLLKELQIQHEVVSNQQVEIASLRSQATTQQQQAVVQQQQIETLKSQLQLQNAAFQERLSRLESALSTQVAVAEKTIKSASSPNGGMQ